MQNSDERKRVIFDTYAWIEYFRGSSEGLKAKKYVEGDFNLFTPSIVIAELSNKYRREGIEDWPSRKAFIKLKTKILALDEPVADKSGELKQFLRKEHKDAGLADAIVLAHCLQIGALILTGDKHFRFLRNVIFLE